MRGNIACAADGEPCTWQNVRRNTSIQKLKSKPNSGSISRTGGWSVGWIRRTYKTNSWKGTLMVINTIGHLAEAAWHHPDLTASYAWVEVRLSTHSAKGITDKDLQLAKKIEDVIQWQPGK